MTSEIQNNKPENEGEDAVDGRVPQLVADEVGAERLQDSPPHTRRRSPR